MREDLTDITLVLDRSGSMNKIKDDTIGGFNHFIEEQKKVEGEAVFSLIQFDDKYEPNYKSIPIQEVSTLNDSSYSPRGWTRLLDAIGKTIVTTGERLKSMKEEHRPGKVIFVILTDGKENDSKEYNKSQIFNMIEHQKNMFRWEFIFLGAKQDAIAVGQSIGIAPEKSMTFGHTRGGIAKAFASASKCMTSYRNHDCYAFSPKDRAEQNEEIQKEKMDPNDE